MPRNTSAIDLPASTVNVCRGAALAYPVHAVLNAGTFLLYAAFARSREPNSRLHRVLELALALQYMHEGIGTAGAVMHRDIKNVRICAVQKPTALCRSRAHMCA